jgi:type I restriction enzyme S subunit
MNPTSQSYAGTRANEHEYPWPMVKLGEAVDHRKEFITIDDKKRYKRCRVQLHAKGVVLRHIVEGSAIKTKKQQVYRAGEFICPKLMAWEGAFGIVPDESTGHMCHRSSPCSR